MLAPKAIRVGTSAARVPRNTRAARPTDLGCCRESPELTRSFGPPWSSSLRVCPTTPRCVSVRIRCEDCGWVRRRESDFGRLHARHDRRPVVDSSQIEDGVEKPRRLPPQCIDRGRRFTVVYRDVRAGNCSATLLSVSNPEELPVRVERRSNTGSPLERRTLSAMLPSKSRDAPRPCVVMAMTSIRMLRREVIDRVGCSLANTHVRLNGDAGPLS